MRQMLAAAALFMFATPAFAQGVAAEANRAEQELRDSLAPAGVAVTRTAPDEIRLDMSSDITFDFNRAYVRREFMPRLYDLARTMRAHPGMFARVVGHTDAIGSDSYNQALSERRAEAVTAALEDFNISDNRLIASGMGEFEPIASNATDSGRARNRRVEILLKFKPK